MPAGAEEKHGHADRDAVGDLLEDDAALPIRQITTTVATNAAAVSRIPAR